MSSLNVRTISLGIVVAGLLFYQRADAGTITQVFGGSFSADVSGTLPNQDTALLEQFNLPNMGELTIATTSYATGGFQPNLILFDSLGKFVAASMPGGSPDPNTGLIGDTTLSESGLAGGMYTLAVTDFLLNQSLTATNLSDGFTANYGSGTTFTDAGGNPRTGNYAFTVSIVPAPEPSAAVLALIGVPALVGLVLRSRSKISRSIANWPPCKSTQTA